jgi:enediyne biosynthesis protein E4
MALTDDSSASSPTPSTIAAPAQTAPPAAQQPANRPDLKVPRGKLRWSVPFIFGLFLALLIGAGALTMTGCPRTPTQETTPSPTAPKEEAPPFFAEVTEASGIRMTYRNGEEADHMAIIESVGGGLALIDYDGDGLLDVFVTGGGFFDRPRGDYPKDHAAYQAAVLKDPPGIHGHPCKLYKNLGNWKFKDVTKEVGLDKALFFAHGAAVADFDNDGWPDLLVTGWRGVTLYHNEPDGKGGRHFVDVTDKAGLTAWYQITEKTLSAASAAGLPSTLLSHLSALKDKKMDQKSFLAELAKTFDKDQRDRFLDLLLDKSELPEDWHWATSAAWADLDGDGYPDLYVCQYGDWSFANHPTDCFYVEKLRDICPPRRFKPSQHRLFHNNRDGTFTEVTRTCCINKDGKKVGLRSDGKGLAVLMVDVNGDGKPDVYVANDTDDKFLYMNRSKPGELILEEVALSVGVAGDDRGGPNGSMGLDAADYNHRGRPSLWVTNYENELHALYRNDCKDGRECFQYCTQVAGLAVIGKANVGWGTRFLDVDLDGWEDIMVAHGHVILHSPTKSPRRQLPVLMRNVQGKFVDATAQAGSYFQKPHSGRGVVTGDLNNRGRTDLIISHLNEPVDVLKNVAETTNHWLGIDLAGLKKRDVVGARIVVEVDGATLTHFAKGGGSYASTSDRRQLIGLGSAAEVRRVTVQWPWGKEQVWQGLKPDRYWKLTEGKEEAEEITYKR